MTVIDFTTGSPFNGDPVQSNRMRAVVEVTFDGVDVTASVQPFLISLRVIQWDNNSIELELDDRDGRLPIPPIEAPIQITIGWTTESAQLVCTGRAAGTAVQFRCTPRRPAAECAGLGRAFHFAMRPRRFSQWQWRAGVFSTLVGRRERVHPNVGVYRDDAVDDGPRRRVPHHAAVRGLDHLVADELGIDDRPL